MSTSLVGLGSNRGNRAALLDEALRRLRRHPHVTVETVSRPLPTAPVGGPAGQGEFLNAAARLETTLAPRELLQTLLHVEQELGRLPGPRWGERLIDLDLLLYDEQVLDLPQLQVPHPRMAFRRFVLAPAAEIAGEMVHPLVGWTIQRLLAHLDTARPYVAMAGVSTELRQKLARKVASRVGGSHLAAPDIAVASGHESVPAIEFLRLAAELLDPAARPADEAAVIGDFWFDECVAAAGALEQTAVADSLRQAWEQLHGGVLQPKLLVLLETQDDQRGAALREQARRSYQGPLLRLAADDVQRAEEEIAAAVWAMK